MDSVSFQGTTNNFHIFQTGGCLSGGGTALHSFHLFVFQYISSWTMKILYIIKPILWIMEITITAFSHLEWWISESHCSEIFNTVLIQCIPRSHFQCHETGRTQDPQFTTGTTVLMLTPKAELWLIKWIIQHYFGYMNCIFKI